MEPPLMGVWLIQLFISGELVDEVQGDLEEIFQDRVKHKGLSRAKLHYFKDAILSIRNADLRRKRKLIQTNAYTMVRNYVKTTFRTLGKNKVYSALNIMGLALGLAACLFIIQYVDYEYSYDKFHSQHEDIYRVRYQVYRGEKLEIDCAGAVPRVGPFMKEVMPEVLDFTRAFPMEAVFEKGNEQFRERRVQVVDPSFLKIFDYPLIYGDAATALEGPGKVVVTESIAKKYFGKTDVVGERIKILTWFNVPLEITGVTKDVPNNSHFKYTLLISYGTINRETTDERDGKIYSEASWHWYDFNTYVLLRSGIDYEAFNKKFEEVLEVERAEDRKKYGELDLYPLQPITDIHLYSDLLQESEPQEQGDGDTVFFLSIIAIFILVIAWINYINLSTAKSMERAKEVGVRKSMGAYRRQLIYQFLVESFVLNLLSLAVAIGIVVLATPFFSDLVDSAISRSFFLLPRFWMIVLGILFFGSLFSGLYPAFILSSFKPISVLKGKLVSNKSGTNLRRSLVVFQFAASVSLIAGTVIVYQQLSHMKDLDLGFDMTDTLVLRGPHPGDSTFTKKFKSFKKSLSDNSLISSVSSSSNVPGEEIFWTRGMRKSGEAQENNFIVYVVGVDYNYFDAYEIDLIAGRNYDRKISTDSTSTLINEASVRSLGFASAEEAIGQSVKFGNEDFTVIGVVADYHQLSLKNTINPIVFPLNELSSDFITAKLSSNDYKRAYNDVKSSFDEFFPGSPFETFFLDDFYNRQYITEQNFSNAFSLFALFAIIVACLGLFGLTSFTAMQRTKEIGIRKVLGADVSQLVMILSKEFMILVTIANVISWPVVFFIMDGWLENFSSRVTIGIPVFVISALMVLSIAVVSVGYKTLSTARSNPIKALRYE